MAKDLCNDIGVAVVIVCKRDDGTVNLASSGKYLKNLVDKGYRKSSDVARERLQKMLKKYCLIIIGKKVKNIIQADPRQKKQFDVETVCFRTITDVVKFAISILDELKKKYTEGER